MALHFSAASPMLPRRVMDLVGLDREWLETEKAKEVLFNEHFNYDAVDKNLIDDAQMRLDMLKYLEATR